MELNRDEVINGRYRVLDNIGAGGAGSVYRVNQLGLDIARAMKILDPKGSPTNVDSFLINFRKEIKTLSELSHEHVTKIIDFGTVDRDGNATDYFIMEYANSGSLKTLAPGEIDADGLLRMFDQIFDAICYLHERKILHFDIKPSNILINRDDITGKIHARLSDLGVSKLTDHVTEQGDLLRQPDDSTYIFGTKRYAPPYAHTMLNAHISINRSDMQGYFPHYDLYCIGASLAETISNLTIQTSINGELEDLLGDIKKEIQDQLGHDQVDYLRNFIRELVVREPSDGYRRAEDARDAFSRRDARKAIPQQVPEIANVGSRRAITHGKRLVRMSDRAYRIICHPTFQRLQRLNQLNLVESIYPEARQTRFSHSLEVYEIAKKVASHLLGEGLFRLHTSPREVGLFLVSALLHDIGHYPLAHTIEDLKNSPILPEQKPRADYEMVSHFLQDKPKGERDSLTKILNYDWDVEAEEVSRIVAKHGPKTIAESIFRQIIDGAIDIDKLAYLCHDSNFTGVAYGAGIDTEALIYSLRVFQLKKGGAPVVGIASKGIVPAESMVVARYHMFSRVYWHHTNRAIMSMIHYVMLKVFENTPKYTFFDYIGETYNMMDIEALRHISEKYDKLSGAKKQKLPPNPLVGIINNSRGIYKRLATFSNHPDNDVLRACHAYLTGGASHENIEPLRKRTIDEIGKLLGREIPDSHVLFDIPSISKDHMPDFHVLDPASKEGVTQLNKASNVVQSVHKDFQWLARKSRILIHPSVRETLREKNLERKAAKVVEEIIHQKAVHNT